VSKLTALESRTLHQPGKLQNVSKNDYGFTPSIFRVKEKRATLSACVFKRVQRVHKQVTGFGAAVSGTLRRISRWNAFLLGSFMWFDRRTPHGMRRSV